MKEAIQMTEENNQTQQMLGRIEVKMENLGSSNDKLSQKMDEVVKEVTTLKLDVTDIKARQPVAVARVSGWVIAGICITALGTVSALMVGLFVLIPKFAGL